MKPRMRSLFGLLLSLTTLVMFGCGGGGGGSSTQLSGSAAAGRIGDGTVTFFPIVLDATGSPIKGAQLVTTPAIVKTKNSGPSFGNYSASISYSGPLLVEVTGGTYTDEASGIVLTNLTLQAAVPNANGTIANVSVTPITSLTTKTSGKPAPGQTISDFIKTTNTSVAKALGLPASFDIITTPVSDPNYTFALQVVSQAALTASGNSTNPAVLAQASADAVTRIGGAIDPVLGTISVGPNAAAINQEVIQAKVNAAHNPNIIVPPSIDLTVPAGVTLSPSSGVVNIPLTISANVTKLSGGAVANGTTVTFTSSAGTITASATTTGGIATATLTGIATPQVVTVSATAGTVTGSVAVTFINDPIAPGAISLVASPTPLFVGQGPVTLTATVSAAGGAGFTVRPTVVTFATTAGTLSSATATTSNGVATVTLNSTAAAVASVTASVPGITSAPASVTFVDPNKPGAISLAANPTSGVTNSQGPVTLSATVTPASPLGTLPAGTPVTFTVLTGTGTLSAVTTTNASGVATAILNSTVVGTVTVNATAGTAPVVTSNTVSVPFIAQPTLVIVKIATTGTLPVGTRIGGIDAIVTANPAAGLTIADTDVTASGAGVGTLLTPNTTNVASVELALVTTAGILTGEFATLQFHVAAGTFPTAAGFSVALTGAGVINTLGANIPGIAVSVLSVTIQ